MSVEPIDKHNPPESFGVFKPEGHVVASFRSEDEAKRGLEALKQAGFDGPDVVTYRPEQMKAIVEERLATKSFVSSFGSEVNLMRVHGEMSDRGFHWVVIRAPENEQTERVTEVLQQAGAATAQKYNRMTIEELIEAPREPSAPPA